MEGSLGICDLIIDFLANTCVKCMEYQVIENIHMIKIIL